MALKTLQYPLANAVNPNIGLNSLAAMSGNAQPFQVSPTGISAFSQPPAAPPAPVAPQTKSASGGAYNTFVFGQQAPSSEGAFAPPPKLSIPTWQETYKPYDPSQDQLIGAATQAGQQQLDAGLGALNQLFGDQRKDMEGRVFQGNIAGSGIEEALYAKQGREESRQTQQLASEVSAQTMMNQLDIMREGTDRAVTLAQNQIDTAFKSGQLSLDEYNAYVNKLQAETERLRVAEDQRRTAIMEGQAFAPEGGAAFQDYIQNTYPQYYNESLAASSAGTSSNSTVPGSVLSMDDLANTYGAGALMSSGVGGTSVANPQNGAVWTAPNGTRYQFNASAGGWVVL